MALRDVLALFEVQVEGISKLKEVEGKLNRLNATLRTVGTAFKAFAGVVAVEKLAEFMHGVIESASAIKDQSERLGISTAALQRYQEIALETNVPVEQLVKGFGKFNQLIGEAELGTKGATTTFAQMGIKIRNASGTLKPTTDLLAEFADSLRLKSVPERTALAMRALGKAGGAMLPMLAGGGEELKKTFAELDELGGGFSEDFIKEAHATDIEMKRLAFGWTRVKELLAKQFLPIANKVIAWMTKAVKNLIALSKNTHVFESAAMFLKGALVALVVVLAAMNLELLPMYTMFAAIAAVVWGAYLIFDDFFALLNGSDSIIGDFLDKMGGKGTSLAFVEDLKAAWQGISDSLTTADENGKSLMSTLTDGFASAIPKAIGGTIIALTTLVQLLAEGIHLAKQLYFYNQRLGNIMLGKSDETESMKAAGEDSDANAAFQARMESMKNLAAMLVSGDVKEFMANRKGPSGYGANSDADAAASMSRQSHDAATGDYGDTDAGGMSGYTRKGGVIAPVTNNLSLTQNITVQGSADKQTIAGVGKATKDGVKSAMNRNRDAYAAATAGAPAVTGGN